jgi:hypothetical protein
VDLTLTRLPATYWLWLGGTTVSLLGTQILAFAMAWVAAGRSGVLGGLVLTAIVLPRTLLVLVGGAVGDRFGAWRTMIAGDGVMIGVTLAVAVAAWLAGDPARLLVAGALAIGIVDAFYLPSSGSVPRRLVPPAGLSRAMSARQLVYQLTGFLGAPVGGLVVTAAGLAMAALIDSVTFAVMLVILLALRPATASAGHPPRGGLWRTMADGLRLMAGDRLLRPVLLLVVATAGVLLPVPALLIPLLAHERHWSGTATGGVVGVVALATAGVAVTVLVRGAGRRPGAVSAAGLLVAAAGVAVLAAFASPVVAVGAAVAVGTGTGLFSTHLAPLVLGGAPETHLARVQSVVVLSQSLPLLATNTVLGATADALGAAAALAWCAAALVAIGVAALASPPLRIAVLP